MLERLPRAALAEGQLVGCGGAALQLLQQGGVVGGVHHLEEKDVRRNISKGNLEQQPWSGSSRVA